VNESQYLSAGRLLEIIARASRTDAAIAAAVEVLERHRECSFRIGFVPKADVVEIYRRRLSNPRFPPGAVLGSERMLDDFATNESESFGAVAVQDGATLVDVWLTPDLDGLVTLAVGRDRRWPDDGPEWTRKKAKGHR